MSNYKTKVVILEINGLPQTVHITNQFKNGTFWLNRHPLDFDLGVQEDIYVLNREDNTINQVSCKPIFQRVGLSTTYKFEASNIEPIGKFENFIRIWSKKKEI